jgi:sucrose-phosphate synthase
MEKKDGAGLYLALISIHGLIRGRDLELGRDADTGGQTKYVVDLSKALAALPGVRLVELFTRRVIDDKVDGDYAEPLEELDEGVRIVRLLAGPDEYLRKELLWDHLDCFADNLLDWFGQQAGMPHVLHSHYADAGYVATRISLTTGIPLVHTGHSLGRDKRKRLMATGMSVDQLEAIYHMERRIEAEEEVLANADLVITSTRQEITNQYELYDYYRPATMVVIPPGTDLELFHPPELGEPPCSIGKSIRRFLDDPDKPVILSLSRADPRKNLATLLQAYGESSRLQELANLVIIAGNRDDIRKMDDTTQSVMTELLVLVDFYDLYGKVALPKHHLSTEVPTIYRLAAISGGVFVNPALTEPFGLTLLEAAASGLPFVATENGGPVDIVTNCQCGLLIDPMSAEDIRKAIEQLLLDNALWRQHSSNGIRNVERKYSWKAHALRYLETIQPLCSRSVGLKKSAAIRKASRQVNRLVVTDLDKTLLSNTKGLQDFLQLIRCYRKACAFGIATARSLGSVLAVLKKYDIPKPDILICSLGTEIYYSQELTLSTDWSKHVEHNWNPKTIHRILDNLAGLQGQADSEQSRFKISYDLLSTAEGVLSRQEIMSLLRKEEQTVNVFLSAGQKLDIVPSRASKGLALRYVAAIWGIPMENILVAGGAGTDEDMMSGNTRAVVVSNRRHEPLEQPPDPQHIYFARQANAAGILEAIEHYQFFAGITEGNQDAPRTVYRS